MSLKFENSRRVAKSRPVCMDLCAREIDTAFWKMVQFPVRNTKWLKNGKLRRAILSAFYNISQRIFRIGILLILWCSFKLWWNFCLDLSRSKFCSLGNRSIRPMKIDIMFLVHNFQKFGAGFFHFSFFIIFCVWILLVNNFLDPVKNPYDKNLK
jgi:hypothetical protein